MSNLQPIAELTSPKSSPEAKSQSHLRLKWTLYQRTPRFAKPFLATTMIFKWLYPRLTYLPINRGSPPSLTRSEPSLTKSRWVRLVKSSFYKYLWQSCGATSRNSQRTLLKLCSSNLKKQIIGRKRLLPPPPDSTDEPTILSFAFCYHFDFYFYWVFIIFLVLHAL